MAPRQKLRSEETKQAILTAAGMLFANRGYNGVSMREIAKEANCSHTTIYIYFKDKEELLHAMSMPPLLEAQRNIDVIANRTSLSPEAKLKAISMEFLRFCLQHKSIYQVVFMVKGVRVDEEEPVLEINRLRINLFKAIGQALQDVFPIQPSSDRLLRFNRIYFFMLNGIINTYLLTDESLSDLMNRLSPAFDEAFDTLLTGFKLKITSEG
ncbi:TetR/AcrR family transcriptional regulator [Paenibacillus glycanilyticus]|uniref:TetR/AcrR family transcriptional regulator n=1 Tax=Paenibacillus glycanilyticus TaxID=126569 RepID=UPI00203DB2CE|nr:TetR/AcrR family transcriptional regulator [Paenibacillus glycanilyticus]MCM3627680.1 TetR/AcrR family transcriptional regulator [Paenibacillus glycanilyticus]